MPDRPAPRSLREELDRNHAAAAELARALQERDAAVDERRWYEDAARRAVRAWRAYQGAAHPLGAVLAQLAYDITHVGGAHDGTGRDQVDAELTKERRDARELAVGRYCPDHGVDLIPPGRTLRTRRYCPKCPEGSGLGFPAEETELRRAADELLDRLRSGRYTIEDLTLAEDITAAHAAARADTERDTP